MVASTTSQDRYVEVDGYRVRYAEAGSGPPLLMLHGLGNSLHTWSQGMPALSTSFRVVAVDLLGHGLSDMPRDRFQLSGASDFFVRLLDALGMQKAFFAGSCMGGLISLEVALRYPERVRGLALIDSAGLGKEIAPFLRFASVPGLGEMFGSSSYDKVLRQVQQVVHDQSRIDPEAVRILYNHRQRKGSLQARLQFLRAGVNALGQRTDIQRCDQLAGIRAPLLLLWGRQDPIVPVAHGLRAAELARNARLHIFEGCGHWPQVERTDEMARLLHEFFAQA